MARYSAGAFTVALILAGLALGSAALEAQPDDGDWYLDLLTIALIAGAAAFLALAILFAMAWLSLWVWRYIHAVEVLDGEWHSRYWPLQRIAQVSGVRIMVRDWAGTVKVTCQAQFVNDEVNFPATLRNHSSGEEAYYVDFPQRPADFPTDPQEGDAAIIVVTAKPQGWRGRASQRIQRSTIGITDHRQRTEAAQEAPPPAPGAQ